MKTILAIGYYHHGQTIILTGGQMNTNIQQTNIQHRNIPVAQLPECKKKSIYETWVKDNQTASIVVVAQIDYLGRWIAYIGYPNINDVHDDLKNLPHISYHCQTLNHVQNILAYGDVLEKEIAEYIFPEWKDRSYKV